MRKILISLAIFCGLAAAQTSTLDQANAALGASDFAKAASLFKQVTDADASNGAAWEGLGSASLKSGNLDAAENGFNHAITLQWRPYLNQLNIARVAAKRGQGERAIRLLNELAASGRAAQLRPYLLSPEFEALQSSAAFEKVKEAFLPCRAPEFREFDFWVGDWKVENPAGQPVGTNSVTLEQDGCLIVEHWKSGRGFETGTSFNYYDVRDKKWHQLYLSNSGNAGAFPAMAGGLTGGKMVLLSDVDSSGKQQRWTWYVVAPGKVRQMAEQTTDGGKSWATTWDSVYVTSH